MPKKSIKAKSVSEIEEEKMRAFKSTMDTLLEKQNKCAFLQRLEITKQKTMTNNACHFCGRPAIFTVEALPTKKSFNLKSIHLCVRHKDIEFMCQNENVPFYFAPCIYFNPRNSCLEFSTTLFTTADALDAIPLPLLEGGKCNCAEILPMPPTNTSQSTTGCLVCGTSPSSRFNFFGKVVYLCAQHQKFKFLCKSPIIAIQPAPCILLENCNKCLYFGEKE